VTINRRRFGWVALLHPVAEQGFLPRDVTEEDSGCNAAGRMTSRRIEQPDRLIVQEHPDRVDPQDGAEGNPREIEERDHKQQDPSPFSPLEDAGSTDDPGN